MSRDVVLFPSMFPFKRKTFLAGCQDIRQEAAALFNSLDCKFRFPLNQDRVARTADVKFLFFGRMLSQID